MWKEQQALYNYYISVWELDLIEDSLASHLDYICH